MTPSILPHLVPPAVHKAKKPRAATHKSASFPPTKNKATLSLTATHKSASPVPFAEIKAFPRLRLRTYNPSVTVNRDSSLYTREPFI